MVTISECCALLAETVRFPGGGPELPDGVTENIGGRVIFGTGESAYEFLSSASQPYPFIIGPDDLLKFCKLPTHMDMMESIGFERDWVREKLEQGNEFRLILFPVGEFEQGLSCISPTWDNLCKLVSTENVAAGEKLSKNLLELKSTQYSELCAKIGFDMDQIPPEVYERVTSFDKYGEDTCPDDVAHARAFLRETFKCTPLFTGDGYATNEQGERGVREFLVKRTKVSDLAGAQWVILSPEPKSKG